MTKFKINITAEISFEDYNSKTKNNKAKKDISRWVKDVLENHANYIPLYIEKGGTSFIEDSTGRIEKIKITL